MSQHQHPAAQGQHVLHVVGGQEDGGAAGSVFLPEEGTQLQLAHRVQADGGLVQEKQRRFVQKRAAQLRPHPLPQRQLTKGRPQETAQIQCIGQFVQAVLPCGRLQIVHVPQKLKGIQDGHVPPQLRPLTEHRAQVAHMLPPLLPGYPAIHMADALRGGENAGEQLDHGALARAVGAKDAHQLALFHREGHVLQGADPLGVPPPQAGRAARGGLQTADVGFRQPLCLQKSHGFFLRFFIGRTL